jgi:ribonuclease HII
MPELIVPPGLVCGVDEAGRGTARRAGGRGRRHPRPGRPIAGLNDSKKLSERKRDAELTVRIRERRAVLGGGRSQRRGDRPPQHPAGHAARHAARRRRLAYARSVCWSTATAARNSISRSQPWSGATARSLPIAAASILAKTVRDAGMRALARALPAVRLRPPHGLPDRCALRGAGSPWRFAGSSPQLRAGGQPAFAAMKLIQSRDNPFFKQLKRLAGSGRERRKAGKPCSTASIWSKPTSGRWGGRHPGRRRIGVGRLAK